MARAPTSLGVRCAGPRWSGLHLTANAVCTHLLTSRQGGYISFHYFAVICYPLWIYHIQPTAGSMAKPVSIHFRKQIVILTNRARIYTIKFFMPKQSVEEREPYYIQ